MSKETILPICRKGILLVPLFHGTSSIFLKSIEEVGLGGINPIQKMGLLGKLAQAAELGDEHLKDDPEWTDWRWVIENMLNQKSSQYSNYRHGSTYLSPSKFTATNYAKASPYGSELLGILMEAIDKLGARASGLKQEIHLAMSDLDLKEASPISIEATNLELACLRTERKEDVIEQVQFMAKLAAHGKSENPIFQQMNFELVEPITIEHLKVHWIDGA